MIRNRWRSRLAVVGVIAVLVATTKAHAETTADNKALVSYLTSQNAVDHHFDEGLGSLFRTLLRKISYPREIAMGQPYDEKKLNIYVVNAAALGPIKGDAHSAKILSHAKDNVLAVPPNIILFDSNVINQVVNNVIADHFSFTEMLASSGKLLAEKASLSEIMANASKYGAISDFLRYRTIRADRNNRSDDSSRAVVASVMAESVFQVPSPIALGFAPILFHELGHIDQNAQGNFLDFIDEAINAFVHRRILAVEQKADDYAIAKVAELVRNEMSDTSSPALQKIIFIQALVATIKLLRDEVLSDAFTRFRGLQTEDFFVKMYHKNCDEELPTKDLEFLDPEKIAYAELGYFPLLTGEEFRQFRLNILARVKDGSHPHHFTRADRFLSAIDLIVPKAHYAEANKAGLAFLRAVIENDPQKIRPVVENEGLHLSFDQVTRNLKGLVEFSEAVNCAKQTCFVGNFTHNLAGFIEIIGPKSNVRRVRLVFPLMGSDPAHRLEGEALDSYLFEMAFSLRIFANLSGKPEEPGNQDAEAWLNNEGTRAIIEVRTQALKCGAASASVELPTAMVTIRTMNEGLWVSIEAEPKAP